MLSIKLLLDLVRPRNGFCFHHYLRQGG